MMRPSPRSNPPASMRAAIYARYSSELQHDRSIADQVALCRDYAARQGWQVGELYSDHALSGALVLRRPDYQRMLADAREGRFDVILAEDVDRLARNQAESARLRDEMEFLQVKLWTVADGEVTDLIIAFKGAQSAMFLKTHALKVRRGQAGRVREGKVPGGLCYGYRVVKRFDGAGEPVRGEREIVPAEAEIVRRIFRDFAAGRSARDIAAALNREGVPPPRGPFWNASTIVGSRKRGNGILRQALYAGRLVYNRQRMVKNPSTERRVTRINAADALVSAEVPALRIVEESAWRAVQARLADRGDNAPARRRSPHLFSGLMKCGACGASFVSHGNSREGKYPRFLCSGRTQRGTCDNARVISARIVEDRVLAAIDRDLLDERLVAEAVREYAAERKRREAGRRRDRDVRAKRLAEIERAIARHLRMVTEGLVDELVVAGELRTLAAEKRALEAQGAPAAEIVTLHPRIAERYRAIVRELRESLAKEGAERKAEVVAQIRALVSRIVIYPHDDPKGRDLELVGELAALLGPAETLRSRGRSVVAEERFKLPPTTNFPVKIAVR